MKTLLLSQDDVPRVAPMLEWIAAMERAFGDLAAGRAMLPLRAVLALPRGAGWFGVMPAALGEPADFGLKAIGVLPRNEGTEHDSHPGAVLLFEPAHGRLVAVIDASSVTAWRTAAVSGLATRLLAREDAETLAILGSGVQAATHLEAMRAVRPVRDVRVWSRDRAHAQAFVERARAHDASRDGNLAAVPSAEAAVRGAHIICTVTSSAEPVLRGEWLAAGCHVNAVGSSRPDRRELDAEAVRRSRIFVDRRESALAEAGDLLLARPEGGFRDENIQAELGELVAGTAFGRSTREDLTLFKSLGLAIEDLAAARMLYDLARASGAGTWLDFGGRRVEA